MYDVYERFFGFARPPFELVPDPDFLFLGESHDAALANLVLGIGAGKGFVAITGPIGAGKTTILRALLRRLGRTDRVCFLTHPETETDELLRSILDGFGVPAEDASIVELRRRVREYLAADTRPGILIIDEAHLLREEALEQIRLLSNLEDEHRKLLQIVLSGQLELKTLLTGSRLKPLAQRIEMFYEILPLSRDETRAYLARRLAIAGGAPGVQFQEDAGAVVHECTGGIPRLINLLADRALLSAYVAETRLVTPPLVAEAYEDLGEVTRAVMPGHPPRWARAKVRAVKTAPPPREAPVIPIPAEPLAAPRRRATPAPARVLSGVGIAAVVLLAVASLAGRLVRGDGHAVAAAPPDEAPPPEAAAPLAATGEAAIASPPGAVPETAAPHGSGERYALHVASFRRIEEAQALAMRLRDGMQRPVQVLPTELESGVWYRVLVGEYDAHEAARADLDALRTREEFGFVRTVRLPAVPRATGERP